MIVPQAGTLSFFVEQPDKVISHVDLLVEIRVLQNDLDTIKKAIDKVTDTQTEEIKTLKSDIKDIKNENVNLKVRMGQVLAISGLLALVFPVLINVVFPQVRENHSHPYESQPK